MKKRSTTVFIADDEQAFRDRFCASHADAGYLIEQIEDVYSLPQKLRDTRDLPDLVVLDLYRTTTLGTPQAAEDNAAVDALLEKIEKDTRELGALVSRVKEPASIKILEEIRAVPRLKDLPVLLYTRQGLSLLSDDEFKKALVLGAEWMLKGRAPSIERAQMDSFLSRAREKRRRLQRDVALMLSGALLGTAAGLLVQVVV